MTDADELHLRACNAYFRRFPDGDCPNVGMSEVRWTKTGAIIELRNINCELARYLWDEETDRLARDGQSLSGALENVIE